MSFPRRKKIKTESRTQIDIYLHVIQSDGGVLPVSVNAASLALVDAGVAMSDLVVACSAGYLDGMPVMVRFAVCVLEMYLMWCVFLYGSVVWVRRTGAPWGVLVRSIHTLVASCAMHSFVMYHRASCMYLWASYKRSHQHISFLQYSVGSSCFATLGNNKRVLQVRKGKQKAHRF